VATHLIGPRLVRLQKLRVLDNIFHGDRNKPVPADRLCVVGDQGARFEGYARREERELRGLPQLAVHRSDIGGTERGTSCLSRTTRSRITSSASGRQYATIEPLMAAATDPCCPMANNIVVGENVHQPMSSGILSRWVATSSARRRTTARTSGLGTARLCCVGWVRLVDEQLGRSWRYWAV
jgi:hypothetical protein